MRRGSIRAATELVRPSAWLTPSRRPLVGSIASGVYGQGVLVITGVIVARSLGPTDRGYLAFILLLEAIVRQVGSLGLPPATAYFVARNRTRADRVVRTIRTPALIQAALLTLVQSALVWIFIAGDPERVWQAALLTLPLIPALLGQDYALGILQGQGRFLAYNILRAIPVSGYGFIIVLVYVIGETSLFSITLATVIPLTTCTLLMLYFVWKGLPRTGPAAGGSLPSLRQIVRFSVRGYLSALSPVETFRLDQSAIGIFLNPASLGLYVVAISFTNLPRFIAQSVGAIAFPRAAHDSEGSGRRTMWRFTLLITGLTVLVVVPLEISAGWLLPTFFGQDFRGAVVVTRILLIGAAFQSIRRVLTDGARGIGLPGLGSIAEFSSWISLVPLLAVLMPRFGLIGVAVASSVSAVISLAILVVALLRTTDTDRAPPAARRGPDAAVGASSP
jgi:O-antigen/teichoic acid export membrane protein